MGRFFGCDDGAALKAVQASASGYARCSVFLGAARLSVVLCGAKKLPKTKLVLVTAVATAVVDICLQEL